MVSTANALAALITRLAISPRLAISTDLNIPLFNQHDNLSQKQSGST